MTIFSMGSILRSTETGQRFRVIGMVNGIVALIDMGIQEINIVYLSENDIKNSLMNEEFVIDDEPCRVIDYDKLPDYAKESFRIKKAVVTEIHKAYGPMFEYITGHRHKEEAMAIREKYGMKKMTFWNTVRYYLQSGFDMNALIDARCMGRPRKKYEYKSKTGKKNQYLEAGIPLSEEVESHFAEGLAWYKEGRAKTYEKAFDNINLLYYTETVMKDGKAVVQLVSSERRPTKDQFLYYCKNHITEEEKDAIKTSRAEQRNNKRRLVSDALEGVTGPGSLVEIDACEADCSIVSSIDTSKTIGRPVVYFMIDVYTRMIVAMSIGFDNNSFLGFTNLMLNLSDDKHEYCRRFGIDFTDDRIWQSGFIPDRIRVDRGSEFKGKDVERICGDLNIERLLVSGASGSLKGTVEQSFHMMHCDINPHVEDNGLIEKRYDSRHHEEATLTLEEYTKLVINFVLTHNQNYFETRRLDKDMLEKGIKAIPAQLWEYGVKKYGQPRPIRNLDQYYFTLLKPVKARYDRRGICYKNLYYVPLADEKMEADFYNAYNKKVPIDIRIDLRNTEFIYYYRGTELKVCKLNERLFGNADFAGLTWKQYDEYLEIKRKNDAEGEILRQELGIIKFGNMKAIVDDAKQHKTENDTTDIVAEREKNKQLKSHENSIAGRLGEKTVPVLPEAKPETEAEEKPKDTGYHGYMSFEEALEDF